MYYGSPTISGPNYLWFVLLGIILIALKLLRLADDCSWWVVVSPFYVPLALFYLCAAYVTVAFGRRCGKDKKDGATGSATDNVGVKSGTTQTKEKTK